MAVTSWSALTRKRIQLVSDPLDSAQPKPEAWLSKNFFSVERPASITVQFPEATNSWELMRASETNDWQLFGAKPDEKLDSSKVSDVTSPFSSPTFNDVLPASTKPEAAGMTNLTTVKIGTLDGFTYNIRIGQKRDEMSIQWPFPLPPISRPTALPPRMKNRRTRPSWTRTSKTGRKNWRTSYASEKQLGNWIYFVPAFAVDPILVPRNQLLTEVQIETNTPVQVDTNTPAEK